MLDTTAALLQCPRCRHTPLELDIEQLALLAGVETKEVSTGTLRCDGCGAVYPIIGGVAVLVTDVEKYIHARARGIAHVVRCREDLPSPFTHFYAALTQRPEGGDCELALMLCSQVANHYGMALDCGAWRGCEALQRWDAARRFVSVLKQSPIDKLREYLAEHPSVRGRLIDLGCGVGGAVYAAAMTGCGTAIGVDLSFMQIAAARQLVLGAPTGMPIHLPDDIMNGVQRPPLDIRLPRPTQCHTDFVVADVLNPPLVRGIWQTACAFNVMDVVDEPLRLPEVQWELLEPAGHAFCVDPYLWNPRALSAVGAKQRTRLQERPAQEAHRLYREAGFDVTASEDHVPWVFVKRARELELYLVHILTAKKACVDAARTADRATHASTRGCAPA